MNAPVEPKEYRVDPSRLASGTWCHKRDRQISEGDISASYSADKIALEERVRSPFCWQNAMWVSVGGTSKGDYRAVRAYRIIPSRFFDGMPIRYHDNALLGDEARLRPEGFYHGMAVKHGKKDFVLIGPSANFLPKEESEMFKQANLFDMP